MKYIDMHCDTLQMYVDTNNEKDLYNNNKCVNIPKLIEGNCFVQFFAIFMLEPDHYELMGLPEISDDELVRRLYKGYTENVDKYNDYISWVKDFNDVSRNIDDNKISAILTLEDGRIIGNDIDNVKMLYDKGFRGIGLTWNSENTLGYPNSIDCSIMNKGLKPLGKEVVCYMQELGMVVDVSHLSDGGFYDVVEISKGTKIPFVATHSNCRTIGTATRNMTDDMIRELANCGGVMGLNFYPGFLTKEETNNTLCKIEYLISHLRHMVNIGGIDCVAIGTDFDGCDGEFEIEDSSKMQVLFETMANNGFTNNEIEKISHKNVLRVLEDIL